MVGEVVVEKVVEKEMGVVSAVELVEGEAVFEERRWRSLPRDPQSRVALNTFYWQLPFCYFSSSGWLLFP